MSKARTLTSWDSVVWQEDVAGQEVGRYYFVGKAGCGRISGRLRVALRALRAGLILAVGLPHDGFFKKFAPEGDELAHKYSPRDAPISSWPLRVCDYL